MNCKADKNKLATMEFGIDITSLDQLEYVMNRIRRLKGVYSVERIVSGRGGSK
jgi:GTP pyrophosphokinase